MFDAFHPSQQSFSHDGMFLGLNQYKAEEKVSCLWIQHSASGEVQTSNPSNSSSAFYHGATYS